MGLISLTLVLAKSPFLKSTQVLHLAMTKASALHPGLSLYLAKAKTLCANGPMSRVI